MTVTSLAFDTASMAFSISQRSQTRPQGLCGEQNTAAWMCSSLELLFHIRIVHTPHAVLVLDERAMYDVVAVIA